MYYFIINFICIVSGIIIGRMVFLKLDHKFLLRNKIWSKFKLRPNQRYAFTTLLCILMGLIVFLLVGLIWTTISHKLWDLDKYGFIANYILFFFIGAWGVLTKKINHLRNDSNIDIDAHR